jgi:flagellar basal body-associated protein FliL
MTKKALMLLALVALMVVATSAVATAATPLGQARTASAHVAHPCSPRQ